MTRLIMKGLNNEEINRLYESHNNKVKSKYQTTLYLFEDWLYLNGDEDECYIEIPENETKSGHAEILDW